MSQQWDTTNDVFLHVFQDVAATRIHKEWEEFNLPPLSFQPYGYEQSPREVTAMPQENFEEDDAQATAIHYSLDIETKNVRMSAAEREAVRALIKQLVVGAKVQLELLLGSRATVAAHIMASNTGRRAFDLEQEATSE